MKNEIALEAKNITKLFPGVVALDSVNVSFEFGKIHCVIGENGAGKSTLIKCLTGVYELDEGEILIGGQLATKQNKKLFSKVSYVPQEIDLFNHLSVAENLFIPFERSGIHGAVNQKKLCNKAEPILAKFNIDVNPSVMVNDISISQRQLLQIARATVSEGYEVLLLDEPTTSLTTDDTERLFDTVGQLKKENKSIVFISHKLEEVFRLGDVITVFRNGRQVAESPATEVNVDWAVRAMTGHSIDESELFVSGKVSDETILEVKNLWGEKFRDISFSLRKGEILGFSGLVGAGRSELMQAIFGYLPVVSGHIFFEGKPWKFGNPSYAVSHGMLYLPEERRSQGILPDMSVKNNASIGFLRELLVKSLISTSIEVVRVNEIVREYDIKTPTINREIKFLSGGNQQKVIIGRSMSCKPKVLIFDEPTKGIDVGTKTEIYRLMREIAESEGVGVILISSEMKEIIKCSNRVVAMYNGRIVGEYPQNTDNSDILHSILGLGPAKSEGGHDE